MSDGPNPLSAAASMLRARRVAVPDPAGSTNVEHGALQPVLDDLSSAGIQTLSSGRQKLTDYRDFLVEYSPDDMDAAGALAFWINLYNAGALEAAGDAVDHDAGSVLRLPGAFSRTWATVDGEHLSLNDIEHGKIRRFGDPRIHSALVCGSVSCPTIRYEPFAGLTLDSQLDDQMRKFLDLGGASIDRPGNTIHLSRIFLWYGRDFTRPDTMPNMAPDASSRIRDTIAWWLGSVDRDFVWQTAPKVEYLPYDWGLACSIA